MFFPASVLIPVLPPTAASTMPSNVVGTWMTRTPRSQVAAANPATSVTDPPPRPITTSVRSSPARPKACQHIPSTPWVFAFSPSGTPTSVAAVSASMSAARSAQAASRNVGG